MAVISALLSDSDIPDAMADMNFMFFDVFIGVDFLNEEGDATVVASPIMILIGCYLAT